MEQNRKIVSFIVETIIVIGRPGIALRSQHDSDPISSTLLTYINETSVSCCVFIYI